MKNGGDGFPQPLRGLPRYIEIKGQGTVLFGPLPAARQLADAYMRSEMRSHNSPRVYRKVDRSRAELIADEYDRLVHDASEPATAHSYAALIAETMRQYEFIRTTGLHIELLPLDFSIDPYRLTPRLAILDVVRNNHLWVSPTLAAFGSDGVDSYYDVESNPLLTETNEYIGGIRLVVNDVFRIVHDYFGHIKEGVGFRADGEENAWRIHSAMYSEDALGALTTELRGQNSWLNFGPSGEFNRTADQFDTEYADQKIGLLPRWVWDEGRLDPNLSEVFIEWMQHRFGAKR
ncbi:hypothetical protein PQR33_23955 [Paraburkholderia sediminicola]|uniref:hypothetical protein n=1 Tax=Paraburkholderia sediminicola TaxID=458836 RepID=UPI0038BE0986